VQPVAEVSAYQHDDSGIKMPEFATTPLPGQINSGPSRPMSSEPFFVVSCGLRLSEVGLSEIRKPQVARSIRVAGSRSSKILRMFSGGCTFDLT